MKNQNENIKLRYQLEVALNALYAIQQNRRNKKDWESRVIKKAIELIKEPERFDWSHLNKIVTRQRILCAAIWYNDGFKWEYQPENIQTGFVVMGYRHGNCYSLLIDFLKLQNKKLDAKKVSEGFLTSLNYFVDRKLAAKIAYKSGQINERKTILYSEDLY